jgi:hypothetical protein
VTCTVPTTGCCSRLAPRALPDRTAAGAACDVFATEERFVGRDLLAGELIGAERDLPAAVASPELVEAFAPAVT